jgi:glycosyltransferase involved in cell wall biosynthesis
LFRLVRGLKGGKYEPLVFSLRPGPLQAEIARQGVEVIVLNRARHSIVFFPLFVVDILRIMLALCRLVRQRRVVIMHTHLTDWAILGGVVGKLLGVRIVSTYQGPANIPVVGEHGPIRTSIRQFFSRLAGRYADRVIAVSEHIKSLLCGPPMHVPPHKVVVIPNGVDMQAFTHTNQLAATLDASCGRKAGAPVVICVGRLVANKGQDYLIRAAKEVMARFPRTMFLLVGDGPTRSELGELVVQLGLDNHVKLLGERSDVPALLASADVFVLPSFWEGISLAVLEAMAAAKPVVATAVGGNPDVVKENETGLLVPVKDVKALTEAICYLLANPTLATQMGRQGAAQVTERFDFQKIARDTEHVYDELLPAQGSVRP